MTETHIGSPMRLVVMGAAGRMGRMLVRAIAQSSGAAVLVGALEHAGSAALGQDAGVLAGVGALDVKISTDVAAACSKADGVLDFTLPEVTLDVAHFAAQHGLVHVIGTTGFSADHEKTLAQLADKAIFIKSGNMSLGVNVLAAIVQKVAALLDPSFDIEIVEMHHRAKVDAPSGTALLLGQAAAQGRGVDLDAASVRVRDGYTGARHAGRIGFATLRGGTVVGDHTVMFAGNGERLELTHRAEERSLFANGALHAALWGRGKPCGLYSMQDVLGLKNL